MPIMFDINIFSYTREKLRFVMLTNMAPMGQWHLAGIWGKIRQGGIFLGGDVQGKCLGALFPGNFLDGLIFTG